VDQMYYSRVQVTRTCGIYQERHYLTAKETCVLLF